LYHFLSSKELHRKQNCRNEVFFAEEVDGIEMGDKITARFIFLDIILPLFVQVKVKLKLFIISEAVSQL